MLDLAAPALSDLIACGRALRHLGRTATCLEDVAGEVVRHLRRDCAGADGAPAVALARLFLTRPLGLLPDALRAEAARGLGGAAGPDDAAVRCLTLVATAGDEPAWNDRRRSAGHRAIPLRGPDALAQAPMIAQLISQLGLDPASVLRPDPGVILDLEQQTFNVFCVPEARLSPHVPAQDFVARHGVRSVLGLGGLLPGGDLFAAILFSRVPIARAAADLLRPLALDVKLALLPWARGPVFAEEPARPRGHDDGSARSRRATLEQLLDVQEQTAHDQALRLEAATAELRQFKFLSDQATDIQLCLDRDARVVYANRTASETLGYAPEALARLSLLDLQPGARLADVRRDFDAAQVGRVPPFEAEFRARDGATIPVEIGLTGIRYLGGESLLVVARDLRERREADAARHASERLYRRLTESTLDAIVVADADGRITLFNPAARRMFGYDEAEAIGRDITLLMPDEYRARHHESVDRYTRTRQSRVVGQTVELKGKRKDGTVFPIEIALAAIDLPDGLVLLASMRDLTERARMQSRVHQAEKLASLGILSAGVAHEINNPLAYVATNLAVIETYARDLLRLADAALPAGGDAPAALVGLAEEVELPYIREHLESILASTRQGVKRVATIVQNLRGFTRLDQTAVDRVALRSVVDTSLEMIRQRLASRGIAVEREDGDVPPVLCAVAPINQVVLNLLVNAMQAIEAHRPEGGRITVRTRHEPPSGIVEVEDNGGGIAPEARARLFEPFFTSKPVGQGIGLGLPISQGIVADHGGRIEVESTPGVGSTFRVVLPVDGKPPEGAPPPTHPG
jgi:PAS domain S-box-containing protein